MKQTHIAPEITAPGLVETSVGTFEFSAGLRDKDRVEKVDDHLDRMRVEVLPNMFASSRSPPRAGLPTTRSASQ